MVQGGGVRLSTVSCGDVREQHRYAGYVTQCVIPGDPYGGEVPTVPSGNTECEHLGASGASSTTYRAAWRMEKTGRRWASEKYCVRYLHGAEANPASI